jgi:hypothetical protein
MDNINTLLVAFMFIAILTLGIAGILAEPARLQPRPRHRLDRLFGERESARPLHYKPPDEPGDAPALAALCRPTSLAIMTAR